MANDKQKTDPDSQSARRHTEQLRQILQGAPPPENLVAAGVAVSPEKLPPARPSPREASLAPNEFSLPSLKPAPQSSPLRITGEYLRRQRGGLAKLVAQTRELASLNRILLAYLPSHLHEHASVARLDAEAWVVQTDSSAWATRLRYLLPNLRQPLSEQLGIQLPPPRIRIAPPNVPPPAAPPPRRMNISDRTVDALEGAARNFPDPRLGAALQRLAEHAKQRLEN